MEQQLETTVLYAVVLLSALAVVEAVERAYQITRNAADTFKAYTFTNHRLLCSDILSFHDRMLPVSCPSF